MFWLIVYKNNYHVVDFISTFPNHLGPIPFEKLVRIAKRDNVNTFLNEQFERFLIENVIVQVELFEFFQIFEHVLIQMADLILIQIQRSQMSQTLKCSRMNRVDLVLIQRELF